MSTLLRSRWGFTDDAQILHQFTNDTPLKEFPNYHMAKSGRLEAAMKLVNSLLYLDSSVVDQASKLYSGKVDYFLPIVALELLGDNAIPLAFAARLSNDLSIDLYPAKCFQINKAYHTGADPMERLVARAHFGGEIEAGKKYVLVDDVTTMGSTLADCASYVAAHGGVVSGAVVLTNSSRSGKLIPRKQDIRTIKERYHDTVQELFNIAPNAFTYDEAFYLAGFKHADALRARAAKATHERESRITSKIIPES